jgi:hypothetical protein
MSLDFFQKIFASFAETNPLTEASYESKSGYGQLGWYILTEASAVAKDKPSSLLFISNGPYPTKLLAQDSVPMLMKTVKQVTPVSTSYKVKFLLHESEAKSHRPNSAHSATFVPWRKFLTHFNLLYRDYTKKFRRSPQMKEMPMDVQKAIKQGLLKQRADGVWMEVDPDTNKTTNLNVNSRSTPTSRPDFE